MTRDQAIRRAVHQEILQKRCFVVVEERFAAHKPSYHVLDLPEWRHRKRLRVLGKGWQNWFECWPGEEPA